MLCNGNSAELVEFFYNNKLEILNRYKILSKGYKSLSQQKSCAYFTVRDFILEQNEKATECQLNKLVELILYTIGG